MTASFKEALMQTKKDFELITPIIMKLFNYTPSPYEKLIDTEGNGIIENILDRYAGIDAFGYKNNNEFCYLDGIASRIQHGPNYETFTIRKQRDSGTRTEFEKRLFAIENGFMYPKYTMQCYMNNDTICGLAVCETKSLFKYIKDGYAQENHTGWTQKGGASFYVCDWRDMLFKGYKIWIADIRNGKLYKTVFFDGKNIMQIKEAN